MLLEFSCANHKSIKDKVTFSAIASSDDTYADKLKEFSNVRVLRSAVIYGANGSGKTNFLNALEFMKLLVCNSINHQQGQGVAQFPHKLSAQNTPSTYDIQFVKNGVRYAYGFSIVEHAITEEYLYYFPVGRKVKIFERNNLKIKAGSRFQGVFDLSLNVLKENRLFLSCAANYSNNNEVIVPFMFFVEDVVVYNTRSNNWIEYSIQLLQKDERVRKEFLTLMQEVGTNIKDIDVKFEKVLVKPTDLSTEMPSAVKTMLTEQSMNKVEAKVIYDKFQVDLMGEESTGIQKLFELLCLIIDIINNGKILICDELESGLHEAIVHYIVETFYRAPQDKFAQLLFTTHDTSLLDTNVFRRDQIWFTQLDSNRSTDLYSLIEIKNVRKNEDLEKGYLAGKYGAIPMLNKSFSDIAFK